MKRLCIFLFLFLLLARTARAATQIQDTAYTGIGGATFNGKMLITAPDMTTTDGRTVVRSVLNHRCRKHQIAKLSFPLRAKHEAAKLRYVRCDQKVVCRPAFQRIERAARPDLSESF